MSKTTAKIIGTIAILLIAILISIACTSRSTPKESAHPGFPLPDLRGKMLSPADYQGKVVFINFWATWCRPCQYEIPDLMELYKQYHSQGLEILGVALDEQGAQVVKPFAQDIKINYPVLIGNEKIMATYEVEGIPMTLVLDRQGKVHKRMVGLRSRSELEALIKSLL